MRARGVITRHATIITTIALSLSCKSYHCRQSIIIIDIIYRVAQLITARVIIYHPFCYQSLSFIIIIIITAIIIISYNCNVITLIRSSSYHHHHHHRYHYHRYHIIRSYYWRDRWSCAALSSMRYCHTDALSWSSPTYHIIILLIMNNRNHIIPLSYHQHIRSSLSQTIRRNHPSRSTTARGHNI